MALAALRSPVLRVSVAARSTFNPRAVIPSSPPRRTTRDLLFPLFVGRGFSRDVTDEVQIPTSLPQPFAEVEDRSECFCRLGIVRLN